MEIPESSFTTATFGLLALLLVALLVARLITPLERRLVTSAAVTLAGLFFVGQGAGDAATAVGVAGWAVGLGGFVHAVLCWTSAAASRFGPLAAVLLFPPAFFGAVLVEGLVISLLT